MAASERVYLAVDLGASSGRVVAGRFDGERISLAEAHRFENGPVTAAGNMHWDVLRLWEQIQQGLAAGVESHGDAVRSLGVDTWGVDFALLGRGDQLLGNPYHYRDRRTRGLMQQAEQIVSREEIFAATGLQFMELNTLYQVLAMQQANSPLLEAAESLLMMPDFFHWLLTGEKAVEATNASTTQFFNPQTGEWAKDLLQRFDIPTDMLGKLVPPGTRLGPLRDEVAQRIGQQVEVILPGTHDTASAVMAVPAAASAGDRPDWCYISSGTWSLMGVETQRPIVTEKCRELNFTNEGGVGGTTRLLKNIAGLWLIQECRRSWRQAGRDLGWGELVALARKAAPLRSLVDPDHPTLVAPDDMPTAIRRLCSESGQPVPESEGAVVRCALESLAMRYRLVLTSLEELVESPLQTIHIVGGGTQNRELCQMAADACGRPVVAGPVEATALGNLMMQAIAAGDIGSIAEAREVIRRSSDVEIYQPEQSPAWQDAYQRFLQLLEN